MENSKAQEEGEQENQWRTESSQRPLELGALQTSSSETTAMDSCIDPGSEPSSQLIPGAWAVSLRHSALSSTSVGVADDADGNVREEQAILSAELVKESIDELRQSNELMREILAADQAPPTSAVPLDDHMAEAAAQGRSGRKTVQFAVAGFLGLIGVVIAIGILVSKMGKSEPPVVLRNTPRPTADLSQAPSWKSSQAPSISFSPSSSVQPSTSLVPSTGPCGVDGPIAFDSSFWGAINDYFETGQSRYGSPLGRWCVELVRDFTQAFFDRSTFNEPLNLWDVSSARQMGGMFEGASSFNQDLSSWNVSQVETMDGMFYNASSFNGNVSTWNVSRVERMNNMFFLASSFNQDLISWNVARVRTMYSMFYFAHAFNGNVSTWDVSRVEDMGRMFFFAPLFNGDISAWNVSRVVNMREMFEDSLSFGLRGRNRDLSLWDVSNVEDMRRMFFAAIRFNGNVSKWDVSKVRSFRSMFEGAGFFRQDLCAWGDHIRSDADVSRMFRGTDCPEQGDPDLTAIPVSPLCFACT